MNTPAAIIMVALGLILAGTTAPFAAKKFIEGPHEFEAVWGAVPAANATANLNGGTTTATAEITSAGRAKQGESPPGMHVAGLSVTIERCEDVFDARLQQQAARMSWTLVRTADANDTEVEPEEEIGAGDFTCAEHAGATFFVNLTAAPDLVAARGDNATMAAEEMWETVAQANRTRTYQLTVTAQRERGPLDNLPVGLPTPQTSLDVDVRLTLRAWQFRLMEEQQEEVVR